MEATLELSSGVRFALVQLSLLLLGVTVRSSGVISASIPGVPQGCVALLIYPSLTIFFPGHARYLYDEVHWHDAPSCLCSHVMVAYPPLTDLASMVLLSHTIRHLASSCWDVHMRIRMLCKAANHTASPAARYTYLSML